MINVAELERYIPPLTKQDDFDAYWSYHKEQAYAIPLSPTKNEINFPGNMAKAYHITYQGYDKTPIHGYYILPKNHNGNVPCIVFYHGFDSFKGYLHSYLCYINLGFAVVAIDMRGQRGETGDYAAYSSGYTQCAYCKGILDPDEYYFTKVYLDCVKALDFAQSQPEINPNKLIVTGGSQGGALAIAVAALDNRPCLCMADVPSNSDIIGRIEGEHGSFSAVADFLRTHPQHQRRVYETVSYVDTMNLADRIRCLVYASVGLKDNICPAKLFYATYNRIQSEKAIECYPFNGHEGGGELHRERQLALLEEIFGQTD